MFTTSQLVPISPSIPENSYRIHNSSSTLRFFPSNEQRRAETVLHLARRHHLVQQVYPEYRKTFASVDVGFGSYGT